MKIQLFYAFHTFLKARKDLKFYEDSSITMITSLSFERLTLKLPKNWDSNFTESVSERFDKFYNNPSG